MYAQTMLVEPVATTAATSQRLEGPAEGVTMDQRYARAMWAWFLNEAEGMVLDRWGSDYAKTEHLKECGVDTSRSGLPDSDTFRKWQGTFADNHYVRGIVAERVYCMCGTVQEATVAREDEVTLSSVIQSVLAYSEAQDGITQ